MLLCPEMTLLARTHVQKRRLCDFIPVFSRLFSYTEFPHVFALSLFWNFYFLTWPGRDELAEMFDAGSMVIDKIYRVLVEYSYVPEIYDLVNLAEQVERNLRRKGRFHVHKDFHKLLRDRVYNGV